MSQEKLIYNNIIFKKAQIQLSEFLCEITT